MKLLTTCKDGGPESTVWSHILIELKALFSVMLLHFKHGSRDAYHSHAFNCVSWVLWGKLTEIRIGWDSPGVYEYRPSLRPIITRRTHLHKVLSTGNTWVLTLRGPWVKTWQEIIPGKREITLTTGRTEVRA